MTTPELQSAYPRELLFERSLVFAVHESEREQLPMIEGALVDRSTARSHEQGVTLAPDSQSATLSVVDTTGFKDGGPADTHALFNRLTQYTDDNFVRQRLLADPILYRKLNLSNPAGAPVISFEFTRDGESWSLTDISRKLFITTEVVERSEVGKAEPKLQQVEYELGLTLQDWMAEQESGNQIGFIPSSKKDTYTATSPLRHWADFKNLQLIRDLYVDGSAKSVLPLETIEVIKKHLSGEERFTTLDQAVAVLANAHHPLTAKLQRILGTTDVSHFALSEADFRTLCEAILSGDIQANRIIGIASAIGSITINAQNEVEVGGLQIKATDPEEVLVTILQATNRAQSKHARARDALHSLEQEASLAQMPGMDVFSKAWSGSVDRMRQRAMRRR